MPDKSSERMQEIIDLYFQTWEKQDVNSLDRIFTSDAVYYVQPFDVEEYRGIDAIKQYWLDHPVKIQVNPMPRVIAIAYGEELAFIEWETTFTTHESTRKIVRGMMVLEFSQGLVKELREHFDVKVEAI